MKNAEDAIQIEVVRVARSLGLFVFHIPNGGNRSARTGAQLKRMGTTSGTPDLCFLLPNGRIEWLEIKTLHGSTSKAQKLWHSKAIELGQHITVTHGLTAAIQFVDNLAKEIACGNH